MTMTRVRVRREKPGAAAWAIALAATMLAVYLLTLPAAREPDSLFASAPVTRELTLASVELWCVSLVACDTPEAARIVASGYADRGGAGCAAQLDGAWHALGAAYGTSREAERVAGRLRQAEGLDAGVLRLTVPGSVLRLTAPAAKLDALDQGEALLRRQMTELGALAAQLDHGETNAAAARALCAVAASRARSAAQALGGFPDAETDGRTPGLTTRLQSFAELADAVVNAGSVPDATLSGLLRAAQLETALGAL